MESNVNLELGPDEVDFMRPPLINWKAIVCWWRGHRIRWSVDDSDDQCQYCGKFIYCPHCGEPLEGKKRPNVRPKLRHENQPRKDADEA